MLKRIGAEEGGEFKAIASGTLPSGKPVVVNADGTVAVVAGSAASGGSAVTFNNANTFDTSSVFDSNSNKVIIAYRDVGQSQHGYAIVGTVSGTSISFGTPVEFENAVIASVGIGFDSNLNKVLIVYKDEGNSFYGTSIVGTVSGTSISFGTPVVYSSATTSSQTATFDSNSNKMVVAYTAGAKVGTISGTGISYGSAATFSPSGSAASFIAMCFDSNSNKLVVSFRPQSDDQGYTAVGTVSGTSISFGTAVKFNAATTSAINNTFDSNSNKVVVAYDNSGNSDYGTAIVGTVSGTSISFGSPVVFKTAESNVSQNGAFNTETNTVVLAFSASGTLTFIEGTVSGTSISFGSEVTVTGVTAGNPVTVFDSNAKKTVASTVANPGKSVVFSGASTNITSENYIGMSRGVVTAAGSLNTSEFQDANQTQYVSSVYDVNAERVVIAYLNNETSSGTGGCIVGTISGSSISFGSFTTFSTGTQIVDISLTYDSTNNKCVVSYQFVSGTGQSKVATVDPSDNSITFGSAAQYSAEADQITSIFDDSSGKVVLAFRSKESATEFDIIARVGTVSGTSISWGTAATVSSVNSDWVSLGNDVDSNKIVFAYLASSQGKSKVGTVSGTDISFGSEATFTTNATYISSMAYHDALNKMILTYRDTGNSNYPTSVVGTVSGTSISFGTPVVLNSAYGGTFKRASAYDPVNQKVFTVYGPTGGSIIQDLTASGTTLVKGSTTELGHEAAFQCLTYISSLDKMLITYRGTDSDGYATLFVQDSRSEVANGSNVSIDIIGAVSKNQGSLTAGQQYFVQTDGTISTTAATPSVLAGTAISATELVVKT